MTPVESQVLTSLRVTPLQLMLRMCEPWRGPRFRSLLLRSALGYHLRQRECLTGKPECAQCPEEHNCWYAYAF